MNEQEYYDSKKYSCVNCGKLTLETMKNNGYCEECMTYLLDGLTLERISLRIDEE